MKDQDSIEHFPRKGEDLGLFQARVDLLRRVGRVLEKVARAGFTVSVEEEGSPDNAADADYVIQYGDLRLRVIALPDDNVPDCSTTLIQDARLQLLQHPDADAVVYVGAGESLPARVFDLYETYAKSGMSGVGEQGGSLEQVLSDYFASNLIAVELPDFKNLIDLPDRAELREILQSSVLSEFARLRRQRARIPEKHAALESISEADLARVIHAITETLESKTASALVERVVGVIEDD